MVSLSAPPAEGEHLGRDPADLRSSLLMFPGMFASYLGPGIDAPSAPGTWIYNVIYTVMVIFFAFFTDIMFNPVDMSDNLKKQGGTVPGVRWSAGYSHQLGTQARHDRRCALSGGGVFGSVRSPVVPRVNFYFGTGLLIVVGVAWR